MPKKILVSKLREFSLEDTDSSAIKVIDLDTYMESEIMLILELLGYANTEENLDAAIAQWKTDNYLEYPDLFGKSTARKLLEDLDDHLEKGDESLTTSTTPKDVSDMHMGGKGIELLKHFEGKKNKAYYCSANVCTIGFGTTRIKGKPVQPGMTITDAEAEDLLKEDLIKFENGVKKAVDVELTQNQFDALVSFSYNLGNGAFAGSTLRKKLNQKDYPEAGKQLLRWDKCNGKKLAGLTRRRKAEKELFES